jgi:outer membrane protein assembly factor BamD (BamD/ComL family)
MLILPSLLAQTPEQQYGFARQLKEDGDEVLALLEYRRFAYLYPDHEKAPEALMQSAMIRLRVTREVSKAQRTLGRLTKRYPNSESAEQAKNVSDFVATNSDYEGQPLSVYLRARREAEDGDPERAIVLFLSVAEEWSEAQLADDALLNAAQLQLSRTDQPAKAREHLDTLIERYPKRSTVVEAHYVRAKALLKTRGEDEAIAAYRRVVEKYPDSAYAEKARREISRLEKKLHPVERTYAPGLVRDYRVVKSGYDRKNRYEEAIELSPESSRKQVLATLEDALIKAIGKRRDEKDAVKIEAYYDYPDKEAGEAKWRPGQKPDYDLEERDVEDVLRDRLFDVLRGR